ncbi:MAG: hypothetical protein JW759_03040 [Candidatus Coatesbacteria bacterium]|nr:hypothetical protein [Candidatus Coatesbacteria bacterium]
MFNHLVLNRREPLGLRAKLLSLALLVVLPALIYWGVWKFARVSADTEGYLVNTKNIADLRFPTNPHRVPLALFPALLTGVTTLDSDARLLLLLHLLMHGVVVLVVLYVIRDLGLPTIAAVGAAVVLWLPPYTDHCGYILTESPAELLLSLGFLGCYLFLREDGSCVNHRKDRTGNFPVWIAGICCSLVALVRPTFMLLSPVTLLFCLAVLHVRRKSISRRGERLRMTVAFLVPFTVLVLGWSFSNYVRFGWFGLSTMQGGNLCTKTAPVLERIPDSDAEVRELLIKYRDRSLVARGSSHTGMMYIWTAEPELRKLTGMGIGEQCSYLTRLQVRLMLSSPIHYLLSVAQACVSYWFPAVTKLSFGNSGLLKVVWSLIEFAASALFLLIPAIIALQLAFAGRLAFSLDKVPAFRRMFFLSLIWQIYCCAVSSAVSIGRATYRVPMNFLLVFAVVLVLSAGAEAWVVREKSSD